MNINWDSPALTFGLLLCFLFLLQLLARLCQKAWLSSAVTKLIAATLYGILYWFGIRDSLSGDHVGLWRFVALLPCLFLCLLTLGELLLTLLYKVTGLDRKIAETAPAPRDLKGSGPGEGIDPTSVRKF